MGGVEDCLRRTIVLLELHHGGRGVILLKIQDVPNVRPTPAVDRLIVVANHAQVVVLAGQQPYQQVLRVIRVLVFVYRDVVVTRADLPASIVVLLKMHDRLHDQVVEVQGVALAQLALVAIVDTPDELLNVPLRLVTLRRDELVLRVRYRVPNRPRTDLLFGYLQRCHDRLDDG